MAETPHAWNCNSVSGKTSDAACNCYLSMTTPNQPAPLPMTLLTDSQLEEVRAWAVLNKGIGKMGHVARAYLQLYALKHQHAAEVAALREALEPFAKYHGKHLNDLSDNTVAFGMERLHITVGELRSAATALASSSPAAQAMVEKMREKLEAQVKEIRELHRIIQEQSRKLSKHTNLTKG